MSAAEALRLAHENGVRLGVAGADLILDAEQEPAPTVLEIIRRNKAEIVDLLIADHGEWTAADWQAFFDERVGIAEFDGGQPREQAEVLAFRSCVIEWLDRHPCHSDPGHCAACGAPEREACTIVPFETKSHGYAWIHPECWGRWYETRKAAAVAGLAALGIVDRSSRS